MDVFALRQSLIEQYASFAKSFTTIRAADIRTQVERAYDAGRFWPEPLLQINPKFKPGPNIRTLAESGVLHPACPSLFKEIDLHEHQHVAVELARKGKSYVVTTGTGSGKSLCFFIPIVDAVLRAKEHDATPRTRAIVIYPMNALANSQLEELRKFIGKDGPVTFARYTGQENNDERQRIRDNPPDILLTNFMMLELLMTRQAELDRAVIRNCEGLQYLVLDELHTYRGRQGADVAMLVRRVRERLGGDAMQCIGTSATMASGESREDRNVQVAAVASRLFATPIDPFDVVTETLVRNTNPAETAESVATKLPSIMHAGISGTAPNATLRNHPLAVWVETRLGLEREGGAKWVRARPRTLSEAVGELSRDSGCSSAVCTEALQKFLLIASTPECDRGVPSGGEEPLFAFKLHQFLSGAGVAYTTLDAPGTRHVVLDGQQYLPGDDTRRLYHTYFCRDCGQEYHPVRVREGSGKKLVLPRDIDDMPRSDDGEDDAEDAGEDAERERLGFVTPLSPADDPDPLKFSGELEDYPESWVETMKSGPRLKRSYGKLAAERLTVTTDGIASSGGTPVWFLPGKFRFCVRCGVTHVSAGKDLSRLASLSAEGRSSATTVLLSSVLRWMHEMKTPEERTKRKLLAFTDNRQDAALQAGHFNDFSFVCLLRSAVLRALGASADGLEDSALGLSILAALGFDRPVLAGEDPEQTHLREWMSDPNRSPADVREATETLRQVLAYRAWFDQRRGWRYTNPNLEELGLLRVEYRGLSEFCADVANFERAPDLLRRATPAVRERVFRELFDYLRQGLAVDAAALDPSSHGPVQDRSANLLRAPWGFSRYGEDTPQPWRWLVLDAPSRGKLKPKDEQYLLRSGLQTTLGRRLRTSKLWNDAAAAGLNTAGWRELLEAMLESARKGGFVRHFEHTEVRVPGFQLNNLAVRFTKGDGTNAKRANSYFAGLYRALDEMMGIPGHPLFQLEAREHTAQVDGRVREVREMRFRYSEKEQAQLRDADKGAKAVGETARFLPALVCSPTMELGVDISSLNVVYLRNVPPTPANYVQRAGRAGRSGQAALVLTYCASRSPHDQYFFRAQNAMVHGEVRPPLLDLANRELIDSHLQAIWLSCTSRELDNSIATLLQLDRPGLPLKSEVERDLTEAGVAEEAADRGVRVLRMLRAELTPESAPWFTDEESCARDAARTAFVRFNDAFRRWRELFQGAVEQARRAQAVLDNHSTYDPIEIKVARARRNQAEEQINLLRRGSDSSASDFSTYRYLATEGFLPGYNFPRLPLMAYVPSSPDGGRGGFLQRPRFLGISEFGPRSLVYHEGRAFRVVAARLALGTNTDGTTGPRLTTRSARVCRACGAAEFSDGRNFCHACEEALGDAQVIGDLYRIENVDTQPALRITANDEERQRQAFELQTVFEWARRGSRVDTRAVKALDDGATEVLTLRYGPGATITRINKGMRRRKNKGVLGFNIDPRNGTWARQEDDDQQQAPDPERTPPQRIVPYVQDQKNALHLMPGAPMTERTLATLQHALRRGIEAAFQLEEGELLVEPLPDAANRHGLLFYEATEGGAGVLSRLVHDAAALPRVARTALQVMHLDVPDEGRVPPAEELHDVHGPVCVSSCYRCLMSYYNQPDHELIDRRDDAARDALVRLANGSTLLLPSAADEVEEEGAADEDTWEARWRLAFEGTLPDAPRPVRSTIGEFVVLQWTDDFIAIALPDTPRDLQGDWEDRGYTFVRFAGDELAWPPIFARLARLLGITGGTPA
jgi:Lhr-like helicase